MNSRGQWMARRWMVLSSLVGLVIALSTDACSTPPPDETETVARESLALSTDSGDASRDGGACRELTLRARHERGWWRHHPADGGDRDEAELSPPLAFTLPGEIALAECNPRVATFVELSFRRPGAAHEVLCLYASAPGHAASDARLLFCSDGTHAGQAVTAEEVELGVVIGGRAMVSVTLREIAPCGGTDGGAADAAIDSRAPDAAPDGGGPACSAATCLPANACTTAACAGGLCVQTPRPAGSPCADGSACTLDACDGAGRCGSVPIALPPSSTCLVTRCDPVLGIVTSPAPDGIACERDACTSGATCLAGSCAGGAALDCTTGNACVVDACDVATGCTHTARPDGTLCLNDTVCDGSERCRAGMCEAGTPLTLDDSNACTVDACLPATGVTHTPVPGCDPTPVQGDAPFETRASILGRLVSSSGASITGASFTVYDERASGTPRGDVVATVASDGSFRLRLTTFPDAEPDRSPPHRVVVVIDAPGTIRAFREGYAHPGDAIDLGDVTLLGRDPKITMIGPGGGTATDSQGLVELVIPAGALAAPLPIQITPLRRRADFPAPLPSTTLTMYGVELEPSGTALAAPATLRLANYRNLPTSLEIPVGSFDPVEGRWEHEAIALWDGARFAAPITHFSTWDGNAAQIGDLVLQITTNGNPNTGQAKCGTGSSWRVEGGSLDQALALPAMHVRGEDVSLSLSYASGLAGSRRLGAPPQSSGAAVPHGSLGVSVPGLKVQAQCMPRGSSAGSANQLGSCSTVIGPCGLGGGSATSLGFTNLLLANAMAEARALAEKAKDAEFGGWIEIPLSSPSQVAETGFVTQRTSLKSNSVTACATRGGSFGVSDALASRIQLPNVESGPEMVATRKVLVHHRFSSPLGAGWGLREVSQLYADGDMAVLVTGDGQEETFRPRATLVPTPDHPLEAALARDPITGEVFAAVSPGRIARLDPATGATTDVLTGIAFPAGAIHALTIARIAGARHFVVATASGLVDVDAGGAARTLASRGAIGDTIHNQASVAAVGDTVFYTDGDDANPLLFRVRLSAALPTLEPLSTAAGDIRLQPRLPLAQMTFGGPRGLAGTLDGSLLVADTRRNVVYSVDPEASGTIGPQSHVRLVLGVGGGSYLPAVGERQPALAYSMNQPTRLAIAEDGVVLVMTAYGVTSFDPVAREAELLFVDGGRDEIVPSLAGLADTGTPTKSASFVALTRTLMFSRTTTDGLVRVDVQPLASNQDPTRTIRRLPGGGFELTDTTAAAVWAFDRIGRLTEQRKRTGETDFTVGYTDAKRARVARIVDAIGGVWALGYAGEKLETITDPAGRITRLTVDGQGDLTRLVEPDGETHAFTYDQHHMLTKTSPRGDVTTYTYAADGTVATSLKPGGEAYTFQAALASAPTYDPGGSSVRSGAIVDARGVRHTIRTDPFGRIDEESYTADGVTRTVRAEHPGTLLGFAEPLVSKRVNRIQRTSTMTVNGAELSAPLFFDSLGRSERRLNRLEALAPAKEDIGRWAYTPDGWLLEAFAGPSEQAHRIERDPAGHVTRIFDAAPLTGGAAPTGREMRFTWRADGQPQTMSEHGVTTTFGYDDAGLHNVASTADTIGRTNSFGYDAFGNVASTSDGTASATFVFDTQNRLRISRDALGLETAFRYEQVGCGCSERDEVAGVHTPDLAAGVEWSMGYGVTHQRHRDAACRGPCLAVRPATS